MGITPFYSPSHNQIHKPVATAVLQGQPCATRILAVSSSRSLSFRVLHSVTSPVFLAATLHGNLADADHRSRSASQSLGSLSRIIMMGWDHPESLIILFHGKGLLLLLLSVKLRHAQFGGLQRIHEVRKELLTHLRKPFDRLRSTGEVHQKRKQQRSARCAQKHQCSFCRIHVSASALPSIRID